MNSKIIKISVFIFFASVLSAQTTLYDSLITTGIKQIYSLQFQKARATFNFVQKKYPGKPVGKFFDAMIVWWKIMPNLNNEQYDDILFNKLDNVIDFCDSILDENENDIDAIFFKGGALGFKGRLQSLRQDWFNAAMNGKEALPLVFKAYQIDSTNVDVQFGFGIYNYYAAVIPQKFPFIKPLMLFFPKGNKKKGLKQLIFAANKSHYAKYEARFFLMNIYYKFEENYNQALFYADMLLKEFPDNSVFEKYKGRILIKKNEIDESTKVYLDILNKCNLHLTGYNKPLKREALYYVGRYYFNKNIIDPALTYFNKCEILSKQIDGDKDTGFRINALMYVAQCNEKSGDISKALNLYKEVLELDDFRGSHKRAQQHISKLKTVNKL